MLVRKQHPAVENSKITNKVNEETKDKLTLAALKAACVSIPPASCSQSKTKKLNSPLLTYAFANIFTDSAFTDSEKS